jgi:hypothetical protein
MGALRQGIHQLLLNQIADHPFGFCAQDIERPGCLRIVGLALKGQQPDLRTVAVGDDDLMVTRKVCKGVRREPHIGKLRRSRHRLDRAAKARCRLAPRPRASHWPIVATRTALIVCILFSAWSKTTDALLSNTSSVTSMQSMPNFWNVASPTSVSRLWKAGRQCRNLVRVAGHLHEFRGDLVG